MCSTVGYDIISGRSNDLEKSNYLEKSNDLEDFDSRFIAQLGYLKYSCLEKYGVISLSWYQVIEKSNNYLEYMDNLINNYLRRRKVSIYNFQTNNILSQENFDIISKCIGDFVCKFFESPQKKLKMVESYGIIYSGTTNTATTRHNFNCDIVINICVNNLLKNNDGSMCFYSSQPSILSVYKKNIRVTFQMSSGDILVYRGGHDHQVFNVTSTKPDIYRTHIIIKCNFVSD